MKIFLNFPLLLMVVVCTFHLSCNKTGDDFISKKIGDSTFDKLADEYVAGYLKWRPQSGVGLGLHEYDGKLTDFSSGSITIELARIKKYKKDLMALDTTALSSKAFYDYKILLNAINKDIFDFEVVNSYKNNPMSYAGVFDVNIYIKRNFAPLKDRVRSIISILNEAPKVYTDAKKNLADSLPEPYIKTAILIAKGTADFLGKDLLIALEDIKNDSLMKEFGPVNKKAIEEINSYAMYLEKEKLPKANKNFPLGRENYKKMLSGEMVYLEPEKI
ncbi:MAG TPA: DUF885 family protein, partial [Ignavibacteria bacterium]